MLGKFIFIGGNGGIQPSGERLLNELRLSTGVRCDFAVDAHRQLKALWDPMMTLLHQCAVSPRNENMSNAAPFQPVASTATGVCGAARGIAGMTMITTIMTTRYGGRRG
jgi:hypothetical protein